MHFRRHARQRIWPSLVFVRGKSASHRIVYIRLRFEVGVLIVRRKSRFDESCNLVLQRPIFFMMLIDTFSTVDQQQRRIEPLGVVGTFARLGHPIDGDGIDQDVQGASQEAEPRVLMASPRGEKGDVDS